MIVGFRVLEGKRFESMICKKVYLIAGIMQGRPILTLGDLALSPKQDNACLSCNHKINRKNLLQFMCRVAYCEQEHEGRVAHRQSGMGTAS